MTCEELIAVIVEYLDGAMTSEDAAEFERHLDGCAPCRAYLATYRRTKAMAANAGRIEMPDEMKARLQQFLARLPRG